MGTTGHANFTSSHQVLFCWLKKAAQAVQSWDDKHVNSQLRRDVQDQMAITRQEFLQFFEALFAGALAPPSIMSLLQPTGLHSVRQRTTDPAAHRRVREACRHRWVS